MLPTLRPRLRMARATRLGSAIALAIGFLVAAVPIAQAAVSWNDSPAFAVPTTNCITQSGEPLGSARVGWLGDPASPPPVNTVYYVRFWWVSDQDGTGQKDDVLIRFHTTEPFPFAASRLTPCRPTRSWSRVRRRAAAQPASP